jgi:hypothetical protein
MMKFFERLRGNARRWLGKAENVSHLGYFGAIIVSGHDVYVISAAGICAVLIMLVLAVGSE